METELADNVAGVHGTLLRDYTRTQRGEGWHTAPDDGYLYTHLAYHLLAAGRKDELCTLLTASPAWMETKFIAHNGDMAYAADIDLALTAFERAATATELLQLAQLVAERNGPATGKSVHRHESETLVWLGRDAEALSHVRLRPNQREKCAGLMIVHAVQREHHRAEGQLLVEALATARSIEPVDESADALIAVGSALAQAGRMEEARQTLTDAREVARAIEDNYRQLGR